MTGCIHKFYADEPCEWANKQLSACAVWIMDPDLIPSLSSTLDPLLSPPVVFGQSYIKPRSHRSNWTELQLNQLHQDAKGVDWLCAKSSVASHRPIACYLATDRCCNELGHIVLNMCVPMKLFASSSWGTPVRAMWTFPLVCTCSELEFSLD